MANSVSLPKSGYPKPRRLTQRQEEVFAFLKAFMRDSGMPPTRAEMSRALGFKSHNAAEDHLRALAKKGVIELIPNASRGIRLVQPEATEHITLPLVGRVAAGAPMLAEQHIEDHYSVDPSLFHPEPHYLLNVHGMSMRNAGIMDGDLVAVHRSTDVRERQIIVARVEDEVTVKRFKQTGHQVWLLPENEDFEPIIVDLREQNMVIEGVVVGVIRRS